MCTTNLGLTGNREQYHFKCTYPRPSSIFPRLFPSGEERCEEEGKRRGIRDTIPGLNGCGRCKTRISVSEPRHPEDAAGDCQSCDEKTMRVSAGGPVGRSRPHIRERRLSSPSEPLSHPSGDDVSARTLASRCPASVTVRLWPVVGATHLGKKHPHRVGEALDGGCAGHSSNHGGLRGGRASCPPRRRPCAPHAAPSFLGTIVEVRR